MKLNIESDGRILAAYLHKAQKPQNTQGTSALVAAFGTPVGTNILDRGHLDAELAERLSNATNSNCISVSLSGVGDSGGIFSLTNWTEDLISVAQYAITEGLGSRVVLVGYELAAISVVMAAIESESVAGVASIDPALYIFEEDFDPESYLKLLEGFRVNVKATVASNFQAEIASIDTFEQVKLLAEKPWMIIVAQERTESNLRVSRELVASAQRAELHRIIAAGDGLRADPRVLAILMGWYDREF
ncbi:MAG: hypothetical protein HKL81_10395 [Acidimicrobiaceae bacterium]|nr:hypothetical protein [Acidimicrobiaceae bacterium]